MEIHAPTVVLSANVAQRILYERYPELFAGQQSRRPGARSDKNLHVALIRMLHGLPPQDGMDPAVVDLFARHAPLVSKADPGLAIRRIET